MYETKKMCLFLPSFKKAAWISSPRDTPTTSETLIYALVSSLWIANK